MKFFTKLLATSLIISNSSFASTISINTKDLINSYKMVGLDTIISVANPPESITITETEQKTLKIDTSKAEISGFNLFATSTLNIDDNGFVKIDIKLENSEQTNVANTTIDINSTMDISIMENGNVEANFKINNTDINFKAFSDSTVSITMTGSDGIEKNFTPPIDSDSFIDTTGKFNSNNNYIANDGELNSRMVTKDDGSVEISATSSTGEKFTLSPPKESDRVNATVIYDDALSEYKKERAIRVGSIKNGRLSSNYSIRREFSLNSYFLRDTEVTEGSDIKVVPKETIECEQNTYFNGTKSVKMTKGEATIIIDGEEQEMILNEEYILDSNNSLDLNSSAILQINKSWNLLSSPTDADINSSELEYNSIWIYKNSNWQKNPETIEAKYGFWIDSKTDINLTLWGSSYKPDFNDLNESWNLLGTGEKLESLKENWSFKKVFKYNNSQWIENPDLIESGEGFWVHP